MSKRRSTLKNLDWLSVMLYLIFTFWGLVSIYSTSHESHSFLNSIFQFSTPVGRQFIWVFISFGVLILVYFLDYGFFEKNTEILYLISVILLLGVFVFGVSVKGANSWYRFGSIGFQPAEWAKMSTALMLAKFVGKNQINLKKTKNQLISLLIIAVPAGLILLQPDAGSALVFFFMLVALFRQNFPIKYLIVILLLIINILCTIAFGTVWVMVGAMSISFLLVVFKKGKTPIFYLLFGLIVFGSISFGFSKAYEHLPKRHQSRIELLLGMIEDPQGIGYNTHQSMIAIGGGGFTGTGFLQGTQTRLKFVPEQTTDFIFCTIGEETGFIGSSILVLLFAIFTIRLFVLAERQKKLFSKVYGYTIASIFLIHIIVNLGMVMEMVPVIGIPLPFFSYGGSSFLIFTLLLFSFLKLDLYRTTEL